MRFFRKLLSRLLWPLRMFGLGSDAYTLWSYREQIVAVASALLGAIATTIFALAQRYPAWVVPLFLLAGFIGVLALVGWTVKGLHYLKQRAAPQQSDNSATTIIITGAQRQEEEERETAAKRKAANDLLGNALEEGESLKQGRGYAIEGDENQNLEDVEIGNEHQARYNEEVRAWVDRTYALIVDAFGKTEAQRFISNEGYTEQELFGRKLPSFLHVSSTQRRYSLRARLKRLHELTDRMHNLDINPDFDPDEWRNR